ncbi:hypothetical protein FGG08_003601 [Glutinoglossum americanum]|uniref:Uncharacterized protein n=1 Tax=Glutinoglossum americanum TaxID=1670608 RepID=A0A9P8ID01_9PEZI|nr:hypothetical protein FGG08_003601 [Glutinoglossum americanum]
MSATITAGHHDSGLGTSSYDAVKGRSVEEAVVPLTTEPKNSPRGPRVHFVSSKRHTCPMPLPLNPPVDPSATPASSPKLAAGMPLGFFRRLRGKIFRHRSQHQDTLSPQPTTQPGTSLARRVIRRASSINLFATRQHGQAEPDFPPPPTGRVRRLSPLRGGTPDPIDVGSVLAFGGKMRRQSLRTAKSGADKDTKQAGPPTKLSPEQLNRRRNRMTVVAGGQTFVGGEPGKPFQWKWTEPDEDQKDDGNGRRDDKCSAPHRTGSSGAEVSAHAITETLAQLTSSTSSSILGEGAARNVVLQAHGEDQIVQDDSDLGPDSGRYEHRGGGFVNTAGAWFNLDEEAPAPLATEERSNAVLGVEEN